MAAPLLAEAQGHACTIDCMGRPQKGLAPRMEVFGLHHGLIEDYAAYTRSFIRISDDRISEAVEREIQQGLLWRPRPR